jgi:hypothetical protein
MNSVFLNSEADVLFGYLPFYAIENCVIVSEGPSNYALRAEGKAKKRGMWYGRDCWFPIQFREFHSLPV